MNQVDKYGFSTLYVAAQEGHHKVVELLLEKADLHVNQQIQIHPGYTPLLIAADKGHHKVVELLLRREDILACKSNKLGETPINIAHDKWHTKVEMLLMEKITTPNDENQSCLVCLDRKADVVLIPCGHQNLCGPCAHQWNEEKKGCPTERIPIAKILSLKREE